MKKVLLTALFLSLVLFLAACGGGDDSDSGSDEAASGTELDLVATNFEFDQAEYVVKAGEEVTVNLVNEEGMHGITIEGTDVEIKGEGSATFTPEEPGEYEIHCSVPCGPGHEEMVSTLVVE